MDQNCEELTQFLDIQLLETKDLHALNKLLDIRLICASSSKCTEINFDVNWLFNNDTNFDIALDILRKLSQISEDFSVLFEQIAEYFIETHKDLDHQVNNVKLLNFLVNFYDKNSKLDNFEAKFIHGFLTEAIDNENVKNTAYETLIAYFKKFSPQEQIECLNAAFDYCSGSNKLDIFCGLLYHIPVESLYNKNSCFNLDSFWLYISSSISGTTSHLQKQSLYILTKYVNSAADHELSKYISCPSDFENSWQAFLLLIDIGQEKQLHLLTPSLSLLTYINNLHFLWQMCVYNIFLHHSQTVIVYQVAIEILKKNYLEDNFSEIVKLVLPAINKNEYTNLSCRVFTTLQDFCSVLDVEKLEIVTRELIKIPWNPVSFYKVIQNILASENRSLLTTNLIWEIINCAIRLPHVYIREKCIEYLIHSLWDHNFYIILCSLKLYLTSFHLSWFKNVVFSGDIIEKITNYLQLSTPDSCDIQKLELFFIILNYKRIMLPDLIKDNSKIGPHVALFLWNNHLQLSNHNIKDNFIQMEYFIVDYFKHYLSDDTTEALKQLFNNLLSLKHVFSKETISEVIYKPLFSSRSYKENQIFIALSLFQILKEKNQDLKIHIDMKYELDSFVIYFMKNDCLPNHISTKDPRICCESINIFIKQNKNTMSREATEKIVEIVKELCSSQSNRIICCLLGKLKSLLDISNCKNIVVDFINSYYENLFLLKRDQHFKDIMIALVNIIHSKIYLDIDSSQIDSMNFILLEISESCPSVESHWLDRLNELCCDGTSYYNICLAPIITLYLQGTVVTKDERTEFNLCEELLQDAPDDGNPNLSNALFRTKIVRTLYIMTMNGLDIILSYLRERYMEKFNKRYFPDSKLHYEKLRLVQVMLALICNRATLPEPENEQMWTFALKCLEQETNQNCVRQLLTCILIVTAKHITQATLVTYKQQLLSATAITNVIPVLYHFAISGSQNVLEEILLAAIPWTMGAQFKLRLYAQYFIGRLFQHARENKFKKFLNKYDYLEEFMRKSIESTGSAFQNTMKSDWLFMNYCSLDVIQHLSTIFYDIPRLNQVHPSEWKNIQGLYVNCNEFSNTVDLFLANKNDTNTKAETHVNQLEHIQKKITPWKSALENAEFTTNSDFILVASLITKSQNLGGLSRTCEVFGIRDIVFNDAKITNDKEFKSLSMSSEVWIHAIETKVSELAEYVAKLKKQGYCVIGAEQTAGSKKLNEFRLPRKMALVLGNEKTGIPPDLIPLLNVCLEIPQFGQTRSLNVHVAGATFIWEYVKQHLV